jgi:hypothetical protein
MLLPKGARARCNRQILSYDGREIFGLNQGQFRSYLFPVFTPAGFAVTSESPADHPHHNSIWIGSDVVHCKVPGANDRNEEYTYNFYVNVVFQGRAPGTIEATGVTGRALGSNRFGITQTLEWRGPGEWGAPQGRVVAHEQRSFIVLSGETHHIIDIECILRPAEWEFALGPTRHAFFNVRVADSLSSASGASLRAAGGQTDARSICEAGPDWVDFSGPVGGGHRAGITVMPHPGCGEPQWFVTKWGVMTVGHFRDRQKAIPLGGDATFRFRVVVRDVETADTDLAGLYLDYVNGGS